jgi:hypothetical protein
MTTEFAEQPEDVRGRPAAVTLIIVIAGIAASVVIVWLLLGLDPNGGGRSDPARASALPTSQPFDNGSPLEQQRAAKHHAIDEWLPAAIDKYVANQGGPR